MPSCRVIFQSDPLNKQNGIKTLSVDTLSYIRFPTGLFSPSIILSDNIEVAIELWVSIGQEGVETSPVIVSFASPSPKSNNTLNSFRIQKHPSSNSLAIVLESNNSVEILSTTVRYYQQNIIYIAVNIISNKFINLYVNGSLVVDQNFPYDISKFDGLNFIGVGLESTDTIIKGFNGEVYEFRVWNGVLSKEKIYQNYFSGPGNNFIVISIN